MKLAWGGILTPAERAKLLAVAADVQCDPSDLAAVIAFESRWNPAAVNASYGATGLIQFVPSTARSLGTTVEDLATMTREEQLSYIFAYLRPYAGRIGNLSDLYMAVLRQSAIGKPNDFPLITSDEGKAYAANKGLDLNSDGQITKGEATKYVRDRLEEGLRPGNVYNDDIERKPAAPSAATKEDSMGAIALPLLAQIIPQVLGLFSGRAQTVITEKTGADPAIAAQFMQALISQVGHTVGVPVVNNATATQAVAALTAMSSADQAPKVAALEKQALATIDELLRAGDKMAEWDAAMWQAQLAGRQASSTIAIEEKKAGLWDMTRSLVWGTLALLGVIVVGLLAAIVWQSLTGERKVDPVLIGLAGPIWTGAIVASFVAIIAYRFDGTKASTEQSKAVAEVIRERGRQ